jgi:hypothetical protein
MSVSRQEKIAGQGPAHVHMGAVMAHTSDLVFVHINRIKLYVPD